MSQKDFDWFAIYWKDSWRIYRDQSLFPYSICVVLGADFDETVEKLIRDLHPDVPETIAVYLPTINAKIVDAAYVEFRNNRGDMNNWMVVWTDQWGQND